jgi:hypothetical protein
MGPLFSACWSWVTSWDLRSENGGDAITSEETRFDLFDRFPTDFFISTSAAK